MASPKKVMLLDSDSEMKTVEILSRLFEKPLSLKNKIVQSIEVIEQLFSLDKKDKVIFFGAFFLASALIFIGSSDFFDILLDFARSNYSFQELLSLQQENYLDNFGYLKSISTIFSPFFLILLGFYVGNKMRSSIRSRILSLINDLNEKVFGFVLTRAEFNQSFTTTFQSFSRYEGMRNQLSRVLKTIDKTLMAFFMFLLMLAILVRLGIQPILISLAHIVFWLFLTQRINLELTKRLTIKIPTDVPASLEKCRASVVSIFYTLGEFRLFGSTKVVFRKFDLLSRRILRLSFYAFLKDRSNWRKRLEVLTRALLNVFVLVATTVLMDSSVVGMAGAIFSQMYLRNYVTEIFEFLVSAPVNLKNFKDFFDLKDQLEQHVLIQERFCLLDGSMTAGNLEIVDLSFKHRGSKESLFKNLDTVFPRWQITAISGKTGSGKSTLLQIIFGVLDGWSGNIRFNTVSLPSRRFTVSPELFALVPQKVELLTSSLRGNLLYGVRRKVPDSELIHLLEFFGMSSFLLRLPDGLNARLEAGSNAVSLGEAQRIALIRAVVSRPKLLLLDEATAHVDNQTEDLIISALRQFLPDSTVVMVTHRQGILSRVDHHLVLEEGRLRAG